MAAPSSAASGPASIGPADATKMPSLSDPISPLSITGGTPPTPFPNVSNPTQAVPSPPASPGSPGSPSSPTQRSFFGNFTQRVRTRSRSRTRNEAPTDQRRPSLPPTSIDTAYAPAAKMDSAPQRGPKSPRSVSFPDAGKLNRAGLRTDGPVATGRSNSGTFTPYGRHSNEWLFGNFSFMQTMKGMLGDRRTST